MGEARLPEDDTIALDPTSSTSAGVVLSPRTTPLSHPSPSPPAPSSPPSSPPSLTSPRSAATLPHRLCRALDSHVFLIPSVALCWVVSAVIAQELLRTESLTSVNAYTMTFVGGATRSLFMLNYARPSWRGRTSEDYATASSAYLLAPVLFFCNWTYYYGLTKTSVASSSTISSTATLFALIFLCKIPTLSRLAACVVGVLGVALIFYHDLIVSSSSSGEQSVHGDMFSLMSAMLSGLYSVIIARTFVTWCRALSTQGDVEGGEGKIGNEFKLVGWVGFAMSSIFVLPLVLLFGKKMDVRTAGMLFGNAIIGEAIPATIWTRAAKTTSPMVTAMAAALMVPLSVAADVLRGKASFRVLFAVGTALVIGSFFVLALDKAEAAHEEGDGAYERALMAAQTREVDEEMDIEGGGEGAVKNGKVKEEADIKADV